jgi:hypothetical protein
MSNAHFVPKPGPISTVTSVRSDRHTPHKVGLYVWGSNDYTADSRSGDAEVASRVAVSVSTGVPGEGVTVKVGASEVGVSEGTAIVDVSEGSEVAVGSGELVAVAVGSSAAPRVVTVTLTRVPPLPTAQSE